MFWWKAVRQIFTIYTYLWWSSTKWTTSSSQWNVTCPRHDIAEKLCTHSQIHISQVTYLVFIVKFITWAWNQIFHCGSTNQQKYLMINPVINWYMSDEDMYTNSIDRWCIHVSCLHILLESIKDWIFKLTFTFSYISPSHPVWFRVIKWLNDWLFSALDKQSFWVFSPSFGQILLSF